MTDAPEVQPEVTPEVAQPEVQENEDNVRTMSQAKRMTKADIRRMQAHEERKRRLINNGTDPDKVEATIAAQDYAALPLEKKFDRMDRVMSQALRALQQDIMSLRHNESLIADAMDINLRAVARSLEKAGVTKEMQIDIIKTVETEVRDEQRRRAEAQQAAHKAKSEKELMENEANTKPSLTNEATPADAPEGATTFGG